MTEEPSIVKMNVDRYRAMLTLHMTVDERCRVKQLLGEVNWR
jgi:hypothetical protein